MRILGIDPGSQVTGFGVVDDGSGSVAHIAHGTLRPPRSQSVSNRLAWIHRELLSVIELHQPDVASVELTFVSVSPRSALVLGEARGAILAALGASALAVNGYAAREIKQAVTGYGGAAKGQVQEMVKRLLSLDAAPVSDAADALAAAICHAQRKNLPPDVAKGRPRRGRGRRGAQFVVRG